VRKEIDRLERIPLNQPEIGLGLTFILTGVGPTPWNERSVKTNLTLKTRRTGYDWGNGLEGIKERIIEFLAVRQIAPGTRQSWRSGQKREPGAILLCSSVLPASAKHRWAFDSQRVGRKFARISLAASTTKQKFADNAVYLCWCAPWTHHPPMKTVGVRNPVFLLDEIPISKL